MSQRVSVVAAVIAACTQFVWSAEVEEAGYVGSEGCKKCHEERYNKFIDSGHPFVIKRAAIAKAAGCPLPKGYDWGDILYVIGAETKKIRFMNQEGFVITGGKDGKPVPTQYNLATGKWVDYHPSEKRPYTCGKCHTTGFHATGRQHGRAGIVGTWAMDGVQCEACHGPASLHSREPKKAKLKVDKSSELCGKCHIRGEPSTIPAKKGFIRHHEQYTEVLLDGHKKQKCVDCHDPHAKIAAGIKATCESCHEKEAKGYPAKVHGKSKIPCIACHMPYVARSALSYDNYVADVRSHIVTINTDKDYRMFTDDGKFAKPALSIDFACLSCHKSRDRAWASEHAKGHHK